MKKYKEYYYGEKVSEYALENGYVDYRALAEVVGDCVLCNAMAKRFYDTLELDSAEDTLYTVDCTEEEYENDQDLKEEYETYQDYVDYNERPLDIYQWYIVSDSGAFFLENNTDEIVMYDTELEVYVWGITHWGTPWDYVLTSIKLKEISD